MLGLVVGPIVLASTMKEPLADILIAFAIALGVGAAILAVISLLRRRIRRHRSKVPAGARSLEPDALARSIREMLIDLNMDRQLVFSFARPFSWERFEAMRTRRGLPHLKIVVDESLRGVLSRLERPVHLLEPECITPQTERSVRTTVAFAILTVLAGAVTAVALLNGKLGLAAMWGAGTIALLVSVPVVRRMLPFIGDEVFPVGGPGYVELTVAPGQRWTVEDSTLLVWARSAQGPVRVCLVGPAGRLALVFSRPDGPEFVRLWQRWAHPQPRLEFVESPVDAPSEESGQPPIPVWDRGERESSNSSTGDDDQ